MPTIPLTPLLRRHHRAVRIVPRLHEDTRWLALWLVLTTPDEVSRGR